MLTFDQILKIGEILLSVTGFIIASLVFYLQAKTFTSQQEITILENKKFLLSIRPEFILTADYAEDNYVNPNFIYYSLKLKSNITKEFRIENYPDFFEDDGKYGSRQLKIVTLNNAFPLIHTNLEGENLTTSERQVNIEIFFKDEVDNPYKQIIHGDIKDLQITPTVPVNFKLIDIH